MQALHTRPLSSSEVLVRRASALALGLLFVASSASARSFQGKEDKDTIVMRDGKVQSVKIDSEDYGGLVVKGQPPIPYETIQSIDYAGAPQFSKAMEAFGANQLDEALSQLKELKSDTKQRKVVRQQVLYYIAAVQERQGELDAAIASYKDLLKTFPKGRYLRAASTALVNDYLMKGDVDGALKAIDQLKTDVQAANLEGGFTGELGVLKGNVLVFQNKFIEARPNYEAAAAAAGAPKSAVQEAQLGIALCLQHENKKPEAEAKYRELVNTADAPKHVLAGAWNGLGDLTVEQGFQKKDVDQLQDALYMYLRGCTGYAPTAGDPHTEYERSLAGSMKCFKLISDLSQGADQKRLNKERYQEKLEKLQKEFPNSSYLKN